MVCKAQGTPRPTRMSNTLLPMVLETAMSPRPAAEDGGRMKMQLCREFIKGSFPSHVGNNNALSDWSKAAKTLMEPDCPILLWQLPWQPR